MSKGVYEVNEGKGIAENHPTPQDESFKACLCTMLILIALLLMIIFLVFPMKHGSPERYKTDYSSRSQADAEEVSRDKLDRSKQFEKYKENSDPVSTTTTTTTKVPRIISTFLQETVVTKSTEMTGDEFNITKIESGRTIITSKASTETKLESTSISPKEKVTLSTAEMPLITHTTEITSEKLNLAEATESDRTEIVPIGTEMESTLDASKKAHLTTARLSESSETNEKADELTTESDITIVTSKQSTDTGIKTSSASQNEEIQPNTVSTVSAGTIEVKDNGFTTTITESDNTLIADTDSTDTEMESTPVSIKEESNLTTVKLPISSETAEVTSDEFYSPRTTESDSSIITSQEPIDTDLESTQVSTKEKSYLTTDKIPISSETVEMTGDEFYTSGTTERDSTIISPTESRDTELKSTSDSTKEEIEPTIAEISISSETTEIKFAEFNTTTPTTERDSTIISPTESTDTELKLTSDSTKEKTEPTITRKPISSESTKINFDEFKTTTTDSDSTFIAHKETRDAELKSTSGSTKKEIEPTIAGIPVSSESTKINGDEFKTTTTNSDSTFIAHKETRATELESTSGSTKEEIEPTIAGTPTSSESTKIINELKTERTTTMGTTKFTTESSSIPTIPAPKVCVSESCKVTASRMLSLINHTQDPCEDFYKFACGGLRKTSTLLEENIADEVSKRLSKTLKKDNMPSIIVYENFKTYYQSCVDYDQKVPMDKRKKQGQDLFHSIGSMVVSGTPNVSLTELLIQLFRHGSAPLFDISLDVDPKHTSNFTFVVTQPKWKTSLFKSEKDTTSHCRYKPDDNVNSELNEAYMIYTKCLKNHSIFFNRAQEAMEAFNVFDLNATLLIQETRLAIEWDVLDLMEFLPTTSEVNLALQKKASVERSVGQLWNNSLIEWGPLLEALFNTTVSNETTVQVYFTDYMDYLASELKKKDPRKLHNALLGIFAHSLYTDLLKTNHPCDREQYCLRVATGLMPQIVSNMYLRSFSSDLKEMCDKASQIFVHLKSTMKEQVTNVTWMDEETKKAVLQKIDSMTLWLPNFFFDDDELDRTFAEFTPNNYLIDSVKLTKLYQKNLYLRYKLNPQSEEAIWSYFITSFSTKTLYIYRTNTLVVPLSVLTPLLDSSLPSYVTIAKTGYHLAQGIAHGFEETGVTYKWNGLGGVIMSDKSYEMFKSAVEISKQLYYYKKTQKEDKVYSMLLDTYQTLDSRLSDVTGAKLALETARKTGMEEQLPYANFTPHQTFHLILLQGFCTKKMMPESVPELFESDDLPEYLRLNYIAQNMEDFGTAFHCNTGSTMNPTMRSEPFPVVNDISEMYPEYPDMPEH